MHHWDRNLRNIPFSQSDATILPNQTATGHFSQPEAPSTLQPVRAMYLCWSNCLSQLSFVNLHFLFYLVPFFLKISASCQNFPSKLRQFLELFQTENYSDHHAYAPCSLPDIYCTFFFTAPMFISLFFYTPLYHIVFNFTLTKPHTQNTIYDLWLHLGGNSCLSAKCHK